MNIVNFNAVIGDAHCQGIVEAWFINNLELRLQADDDSVAFATIVSIDTEGSAFMFNIKMQEVFGEDNVQLLEDGKTIMILDVKFNVEFCKK